MRRLQTTPVLSLVLCSRNDRYMGNSRWRLETALNYVAGRVEALGREQDVEVLVADWGSEVPLREVLVLGPTAARIVSFVTVPPALARDLQGDSPFPEVLALNAAARRARGDYIGRIDQDTLVGERFLRWFFEAAERGRALHAPDVALETALLFANHRTIPYRFAVLCPPRPATERFVKWLGRRLPINTGPVFFRIDVGIWLLHRRLWWECGGYDERMIYMNDMEIDMATRLMSKYTMIDLGKLTDYDFYHLEHYHPRGLRSSGAHRRMNGQSPREPLGFRPSGDGWGLAAHPLGVVSQAPERGGRVQRAFGRTVLDVPIVLLFIVLAGVRMAHDFVVYDPCRAGRQRWTRRARIAWATVHGQPVSRWLHLLRRIWIERPSARAGSEGRPEVP